MIAPNHVESGTGRILFTETAAQQGAISGKYLVKPGDLIYSKIRPALNKACIATGDWLCSADMYPVKVTASELRSKYLLYFVLSEPFVRLMVDESMRVAMPKVNRDKLAACPIPLPTPGEQDAITSFLDREMAKVDVLVAEKERLIQLLEERRSALITRSITKGLDPNARMKDSGVGWLGRIPAHWRVARLIDCTDRLVPIVYGILLPGPRLDEGIPYIGAGDVVQGRLRLAHLPRTTPEISAQYPRSVVRGGELVYAIRGSYGSVDIVPSELDGVNLSRDAARIAPATGVSASWLRWSLRSQSSQGQFGFREIGTAVTGVNIRDLKRVVLPLPPRDERDEIAAFLDRASARLDALAATVHEGLECLKEYRMALISAAVTGKIDVRDEVA